MCSSRGGLMWRLNQSPLFNNGLGAGKVQYRILKCYEASTLADTSSIVVVFMNSSARLTAKIVAACSAALSFFIHHGDHLAFITKVEDAPSWCSQNKSLAWLMVKTTLFCSCCWHWPRGQHLAARAVVQALVDVHVAAEAEGVAAAPAADAHLRPEKKSNFS